MMDLNGLVPFDLSDQDRLSPTILMRAILMRTNFVPGARHVIGWRGLKDSSMDDCPAWTAKIRNFQGVFGLEYQDGGADDPPAALFRLLYFPDPDEELLDRMSVQAGFVARQPGYLKRVREFPEHDDLRSLFNIGLVRFKLAGGGQILQLGFEGASRQRVVAVDGLRLDLANGPVQLIEPGGLDQDFPSLDVVASFFRILAASATYVLNAPPCAITRAKAAAESAHYDQEGNVWRETNQDLYRERLDLVWGEPPESAAPGRNEWETDIQWAAGDPRPGEYADALWWSAHNLGDFKSLDKKILGVDDRPRLIVLTGFLGSGKTTFLRNFLEYQERMNRFVAVIQNEIGETGLDGKILDRQYAVTEIDEGCVCCTLSGNVKAAVSQIMAGFHPDCIVLETTGLANPLNLLDEIEELEELVRFDSVTCVADASTIDKCLAEYEIAEGQLKAADLILLNKIDLVPPDKVSRIMPKIKAVNSRAPVVQCVNGDLNPALLYGDGASSVRDPGMRPRPSHTHGHCHDHAREGLTSVKIDLPEPLDQDFLIGKIESLPDRVFRAKGLISIQGRENPAVLQYVSGRYELSEQPVSGSARPFIVLIGRSLDERDWTEYFSIGAECSG